MFLVIRWLCHDETVLMSTTVIGFVKRAEPGFLERGFICIKVWGVGFAGFISFFINVPWK